MQLGCEDFGCLTPNRSQKLEFSSARAISARRCVKQLIRKQLIRKVEFYLVALFQKARIMSDTQRIYFIGNSVTDTINQAGLKALANSQNHDLIWRRQMIPGAPLSWIWEHPNDGFNEEPFGRYPNALNQYTWDGLSLQPFDRPLSGEDGDLAMASNFINLAKQRNPDLQVYVYQRWPRKPEGNQNPSAEEWNQIWLRPYAGGYANNESRAYFTTLAQAIKSAYPDLKAPIVVPVGEVLYELNKKMQSGQVPGYSSIWQLYSDNIHFNNMGAYIAAATFYATVYKADPLNVPIPAQYGAIDPALAKIFQQTVWETIGAGGSTNPINAIDPGSTQPMLFLTDVLVVEGEDAEAQVKVSLSQPSSQSVTVNYATADGSAEAGSAYDSKQGTLTFAAGETSKTIAVAIRSDRSAEANETFTVTLSNASNAGIVDAEAIVTIGDTVKSAVNTTLPEGMMNLTLTGKQNIRGIGNSGRNQITGNRGDNLLDGRAGYDTLKGGAGDDTYIVEGAFWDVVVEAANQGKDTVKSIDSYVLAENLENLVLLGNSISGTGNALRNQITGNSVANVLAGDAGADRLDGRAGNDRLDGGVGPDVLLGGTGADILLGGEGRDTLIGGSGQDQFVFGAAALSFDRLGVDAIIGFSQSDKIVLSRTTFGLTSVIGSGFSDREEFAVVRQDAAAAATNAKIVYSRNSGKLFYNSNGAAAGFGLGGQFAVLPKAVALNSNQFAIEA